MTLRNETGGVDGEGRSLTVQMLLLRAYAFLGGGLADGLGESLASKAVTGGQQPVVDRLPCHSHDEGCCFCSSSCSRWLLFT